MRVKFRVVILKTLYKLHLENSATDGVHEKKAKALASDLLNKDLEVIEFCPRSETSRLIKLIPLVRKITNMTTTRKKDRNKIACAIILMLYYGYVLSEQSDDFIPDMSVLLRELLGYEDGKKAYDYVVHIAGSNCHDCSRLRKFFLFGKDL